MKNRYLTVIILLLGFQVICSQTVKVNAYLADIKQYGKDPLEFVSETLHKYDLIVFDDALHSAYEPFVFYNQIINQKDPSGKIDYIFLEAINTTAQPAIDSFLNAPAKDSTILVKAFQDDYSGMGWRFQTYLDLFSKVWEHNHQLIDLPKIEVVGVNPPIYWEALHTWKDYELFQNTLDSRDYFMYLQILKYMNGFNKDKKGIFLTNTRHAYKNISNSAGKLYWNTTTFFNQWNRNKVFSIRLHNVTLSIQSVKTPSGKKTTDGLSETIYKWIRMDGGRWDSAFALNANKPVAIPLMDNNFGKTGYVGNHMLNVASQATMYDAYDALIFLAPITNLHLSAMFNFIYTPAFKKELERRLRLLKGNEFESFLEQNMAKTFDEYFKKEFEYQPVTKNSYLNE